MTTTAQTLLEKVAPRAGPLIITVFGDTIAPRGGSIWLGNLIELMQPLGLSERLVRTGVYRLAREGWLKARQNGRRSSYTITSKGLDTFADADGRIYATHPLPWDGKWTIIQTLPDASPDARKEIRNLLTWHGFGQISPTMMIKPGSNADTVNQVLHAANLSDACIAFFATLEQSANPHSIVTNGWNLHDLSNSYSKLLNCFHNCDKINNEPETAFTVRSLLIHQYRRILLKDPQLPSELLPPDWNGEKAREMVARNYKKLSPATDQFIIEKMQSSNEKCPTPNSAYGARFKAD